MKPFSKDFKFFNVIIPFDQCYLKTVPKYSVHILTENLVRGFILDLKCHKSNFVFFANHLCKVLRENKYFKLNLELKFETGVSTKSLKQKLHTDRIIIENKCCGQILAVDKMSLNKSKIANLFNSFCF